MNLYADDSTSFGIFRGATDVGNPRIPGATIHDSDRQTYALAGAGSNMWNDRDEFQFVWKRLRGDFLIRAHVKFLGEGAVAHRKIGCMIRSSLAADAAYVDVAVHGDGLTSMQFRKQQGGETQEVQSSITGVDVVQLERRSGVYIMSVAQFGEPFATDTLTNVDLEDEVYVGLFICSHDENVVERAVFSNVRLVVPAPADFVPYRDYIGSRLEVMDVESGLRRVVYEVKDSLQAPNWTRDGAALICNRNGRLYRFDLATSEVSEIPTDFAVHNNNDHVLSFDGTMLAISHQAEEHDGNSVIYTVPVVGGVPRQITSGDNHSYLHGWSPDGRWLVFTGQRNDNFDIYKIPAGSGDEVRLTTYEGLDDGPEFSPDGRTIYFNSTRSGNMQIWRMDPDGSGQSQLTRDEYNNWFPHVSPDGKWIAYIAFPPDIDPDAHPFYKHVMLRLMPTAGGPAKTIAYVYGGQGTMNVPSWSPDGKSIAFVSNSVVE